MGLSAIKCEGYSGILEVARAGEWVSAYDFSLGENVREKIIYAAAIGAGAAWAGYWIMGTPTYSEMCGHNNNNNQSNATENMTVEDVRCEKDDDGIVAVPPLLYAHYP